MGKEELSEKAWQEHKREDLIKSATDFIAVIDDFSKEFQEDAIPLMADFALLVEQAVIQRIVDKLKDLHMHVPGTCEICEYITELEKEITDADK